MACVTVKSGFNGRCFKGKKKYEQEFVLVNKADVKSYIISLKSQNNCQNRVYFNLNESKKGLRFSASDRSDSIRGLFNKVTKGSIVEYEHTVESILFGNDESTKCLYRALSTGDYFIALQVGNTIEIYGFEFGLTLSDDVWDLTESGGVIPITFKSEDEAFENSPPLIYKSPMKSTSTPVKDFDDLFEDVGDIDFADFNEDYNEDYLT